MDDYEDFDTEEELEELYEQAVSLVEVLLKELQLVDQFLFEKGVTKDEYQQWKRELQSRTYN